MFLFSKSFVDMLSGVFYGKMNDALYYQKFHEILELAYTYLYIGAMKLSPTEANLDKIILNATDLGITSDYYYGEGRPLFAVAKANAQRWRYLCQHPAEREQELQKLRQNPPPTCPATVDIVTPKWREYAKQHSELKSSMKNLSHEQWMEFYNTLGYPSPLPIPKLIDCLPAGLKSIPQ